MTRSLVTPPARDEVFQVPSTSLSNLPTARPCTADLEFKDSEEGIANNSNYFAADGGIGGAIIGENWARHSRRATDISELLTPVVQAITFSQTITFTSDRSVITTSITSTTVITIFPGKPFNQIATPPGTPAITEKVDPPGTSLSSVSTTGNSISSDGRVSSTVTSDPTSTRPTGSTTNPASVIAPAVVAALLGVVILLVLFGYFVVRRRRKGLFRVSSTAQAEMISAWDVRPSTQVKTNSSSQSTNPPRKTNTKSAIPVSLSESSGATSVQVEPPTSTQDVAMTDDDTFSFSSYLAQLKPLPDVSGEEFSATASGNRQNGRDLEILPKRPAPSGPSNSDPSSSSSESATVRPGQVNATISEILQGFTTEIRAEIHAAISRRSPTNRPQAGWNADDVRSRVSQQSAPPEYQE